MSSPDTSVTSRSGATASRPSEGRWLTALAVASALPAVAVAVLDRLLPEPTPGPLPESLPLVSVLVAARNESDEILGCLSALDALTYPHLEIIVGDDRSTDDTAARVRAFAAQRPHVRLLSVVPAGGLVRGKANALSQLARAAQGDFLAITDADVRVPPGWVEGLLRYFGARTGLVGGFTTVAGETLGARWQAIDWAYALRQLRVLNALGRPLVAMGNNMMVRTAAYRAVGGYERIPFSVTEDVALVRVLGLAGWRCQLVFDPTVRARTRPAGSVAAWLSQRRRWLRGGRLMPPTVGAYLASHLLFFVVLLPLARRRPARAGVLWVLRWASQVAMIGRGLRQVETPALLPYRYLYELAAVPAYSALIAVSRASVRWKGRTYD